MYSEQILEARLSELRTQFESERWQRDWRRLRKADMARRSAPSLRSVSPAAPGQPRLTR